MTSSLFVALCSFVAVLRLCNSCQPPTKENPVSICAFCSDHHAAMRWMVHGTHGSYEEEGVNSINFEFQCDTLEDNETQSYYYDHDDCFDGLRLSHAQFGEWRWYILERELPLGTTCTFRAKLTNPWYEDLPTLHSSCTTEVKDHPTCPVFPVFSCSGSPGDSQCSCSCNQGFTTHTASTGVISCQNIDECLADTHNCSSAAECVDREGSYWCNEHDSGSGAQLTVTPDSQNGVFEQPCVIESVDSVSKDGPNITYMNTELSTSTPDITTAHPMPTADNRTAHFTTASHSNIIQKPGEHDNTKPLPSSPMSTGQFDSVGQAVVTLASVLLVVILSVLVLVIVAFTVKRYKSGGLRQPSLNEPFDPEYNPVTIEKFSPFNTSLMSIINSLHHFEPNVSGSKRISGENNQDTDSCVSSIGSDASQSDRITIIDSERSSNFSQILDTDEPSKMKERDGTVSEQSSLTLDMTSLGEREAQLTSDLHHSGAIPTISSNGYTSPCSINWNQPCIVQKSSRDVNSKQLNSVTSGYITPTSGQGFRSGQSSAYHHNVVDVGGPVMFQWNSNLNSPDGSYVVGASVLEETLGLLSTPVYFDFPRSKINKLT